jgi:tetratricopeptide (TPR) repeat protein
MGMKENLLELVQDAHQEELVFISRLSDAERAVVGTAQAWSAKDLVGHVITWLDRMVDNFHTAARGEPLPDYGEIDSANAGIFAENAAKSWDDLRQMIDHVCTRVTDYVQAASEADLVDPERSVLKNNRPLWQNIAGNAVTHALLHLGQYYADHGQAAYATPMQERITQRLMTLEDTPKWHANATYNLACYYALAGQKAPAITKLGEALKLDPGLTEWSTQDADLASIRDEAGYKALYV